jgi:4-alpha-glucanotransferase
MAIDNAFEELAALAGIEPDFWSFTGEQFVVSRRSKAEILKAMGFPADTPDAARQSLQRFNAQFWRDPVGPVHIYRGSRTEFTVPVNVPLGDISRPIRWHLQIEDEACLSGEAIPHELIQSGATHLDGSDIERRNLVISQDLPMGYHRLTVEVGDLPPAETTMIVSPESAFVPPWLEAGDRRWGLACFLPGLRSAANWGIGDFTDLGELAAETSGMGASYIGLNPLHALFPEMPEEASPYSPSSRTFLNVLHIDVTRMDGFSDCPAIGEMMGTAAMQDWLGDILRADMIDFTAVAEKKMEAFRLLFRHFKERRPDGTKDKRSRDFQDFKISGGEALRQFATFEALHQKFGVRDWRNWPAEFQYPQSPSVSGFARENDGEVDFHMFLQWQADCQLAAFADRAGNAEPEIGLYGDIAVGCHMCGADSWREGDLYAGNIRFGAPPDPFNAEGQNWGMAPINPRRLWQLAFKPFVALMRSNMRHAGALRIDHVMSLRRLFWIPEGGENRAGAYVNYPLEDLLAIVALESHRNGCMVVGEDLGTVPEGFRERLAAEKILSYRAVPFERHESKLLFRPDNYPQTAVVTSGTHDMPPILGHWRGNDIALRRRLADVDDPELWLTEERARGEDRELVRAALVDQGLLAADFPLDAELGEEQEQQLILAIERFAARTPSALLMVNLDDLLRCADLLNLPGTILEHPNWRKKSELPVGEISRDRFVGQLIDAITAERRA